MLLGRGGGDVQMDLWKYAGYNIHTNETADNLPSQGQTQN